MRSSPKGLAPETLSTQGEVGVVVGDRVPCATHHRRPYLLTIRRAWAPERAGVGGADQSRALEMGVDPRPCSPPPPLLRARSRRGGTEAGGEGSAAAPRKTLHIRRRRGRPARRLRPPRPAFAVVGGSLRSASPARVAPAPARARAGGGGEGEPGPGAGAEEDAPGPGGGCSQRTRARSRARPLAPHRPSDSGPYRAVHSVRLRAWGAASRRGFRHPALSRPWGGVEALADPLRPVRTTSPQARPFKSRSLLERGREAAAMGAGSEVDPFGGTAPNKAMFNRTISPVLPEPPSLI